MHTDRLRLFSALLLILLLTTACNSHDKQSLRFYALGTVIEVSLHDPDAGQTAAIERRLIAAFQHWQTHWHPWQTTDADHNLAAINESLAQNGEAEIDIELRSLLHAARPFYEQSGGLFDPAIGGLVRLWGFNQESTPTSAPDEERLDGWLESRPRYSDLVLRKDRVISRNRNVQLDFGAFAKGYALNQAAALLRDHNIHNALINAGGDLIVMGNAGTRPWRAGIRHPRASGILATVELADGEALVTSGDYERYFMADDKRYHHILDPRTARPAGGVIAVSVIDHDAARADAAATALFVAGTEEWRRTAATMNIECAMLIDDQGRIHMTDCMHKRLQFSIDPDKGIEVSP